jgi:hypothetical protein
LCARRSFIEPLIAINVAPSMPGGGHDYRLLRHGTERAV